jgi:hypothetical protein
MKKAASFGVSIIVPTKVWDAKMAENGRFLGFILRGPILPKMPTQQSRHCEARSNLRRFQQSFSWRCGKNV